MRRIALLLFLVTATWLLSGCTLIGLGIGAAVPNYERADDVDLGERVRVDAFERHVDGRVVATDPRRATISVATSDGVVELGRREIKKIERHAGSNAMFGASIGFTVDLVLGAVLALVVAGGVRASPPLVWW